MTGFSHRASRRHAASRLLLKTLAVVLTASAGLGLGGCAGTGSQLLKFATTKPGAESETATKLPENASELDRAIAYWQQAYTKDPRNKTAALSLARNLRAAGNKRAAYGILQEASVLHGKSREVSGEYGRLALEFGQTQSALRLLKHANDPAKPDWRVLSALGAAYAKVGELRRATDALEQARTLAPDQASIANNLAMIYVAQRDLKRAETLLRDIAFRPNATPRMRQNLALVLGLQGQMTEAKALAAEDTSTTEAYARIDKLAKMRSSSQPTRSNSSRSAGLQRR
ncbi:MAG: tetratricopeptide repeat protein [Pseudomonadota bacterium]